MLLLRPDQTVHPSTVPGLYSQQVKKQPPFSLVSVFSQAALAAGQCPGIIVSVPDGGKRGASRNGIPKCANEHGDPCVAQRGNGRNVRVFLDVRDVDLGLVLGSEEW